MRNATPRSPAGTPFRLLLRRTGLTEADLGALEQQAGCDRLALETLLIERHGITEDELRGCLAEWSGCPVLGSLDEVAHDPRLLRALSPAYLETHYWLPLAADEQGLDVVIDDPHDLEVRRDIGQAFPRRRLRLTVALRRDIVRLRGLLFGRSRPDDRDQLLRDLIREHRDEAPRSPEGTAPVHEGDNSIIRLANQILADAYQLGASDVHIEPYASKDISVRVRIDGVCLPYMSVPAICRRALISRFKIMANLDIAERRKPQDGKIRVPLSPGRSVEVRVATIPTGGCDEDVVLRILTGKGILPLDAMDLSPSMVVELKRLSAKPYGLILCVGPTGSGKTTTLHALLATINTQDRKIWTAEDPIEITQDGLRQVQVHPKIGFTFAAALRAFLRADPDVIMIGEMRDRETAEIALEASLTGHLVMSTLHTNSAVETVTRLLDLGCDPFHFADALLGVLAKRLCRRLCERCKQPAPLSEAEQEELAVAYGVDQWQRLGRGHQREIVVHRPVGCEACKGTGYHGRIGLYELLVGSEEMRGLIQARTPTGGLLRGAVAAGMTTLVQDGIHKVLAGLTTCAEVQRVALK